jgi:hypothetical protein
VWLGWQTGTAGGQPVRNTSTREWSMRGFTKAKCSCTTADDHTGTTAAAHLAGLAGGLGLLLGGRGFGGGRGLGVGGGGLGLSFGGGG